APPLRPHPAVLRRRSPRRPGLERQGRHRQRRRPLRALGQPAPSGGGLNRKDATKEESRHDEQGRAEVQRVRQLVRVPKETLLDAWVFAVGKKEGDASIVGRTDAGGAGLKTRVVQT